MIDYVPVEGDQDHPTELQEIVVTAKGSQKPTVNSKPITRGIDRYIGKNYSKAFNDAYNKMGNNPFTWTKWIPSSYWDSETHKNIVDGNNAAAAMTITPFAMYAAAASPVIGGAMNLWGAYEGGKELLSDNGVKKTYNLLKNGQWWDAAKSAGGDIFDLALTLPVLNRVRQGAQWLGRGIAGETVNEAINSLSPKYNSVFNWRTGKFTLNPKLGITVSEKVSNDLKSLDNWKTPNNYGLVPEMAGTSEMGMLPTGSRIATVGDWTTPARETSSITPARAVNTTERAAPQIALTRNTARPINELLTDNSYALNEVGDWEHRDGSSFRVSNSGGITFKDWLFPRTEIKPEDMEAFLHARSARIPYTHGLYNGLQEFMLGNYKVFNNPNRIGGNMYEFQPISTSGLRVPMEVQENSGVLQIGTRGGVPIEFPITNTTTRQEVYDAIQNYINNIELSNLTPQQENLIQSIFPNEDKFSPRIRGIREFSNSSGRFTFNPLSNTFSLRGEGYRNVENEPIANLTEESISPIKIPSIYIPGKNLPDLDKTSIGSDWQNIFGTDFNINQLIDFGLWRPRPTLEQAKQAIGGRRIDKGDVHVTLGYPHPRKTDNFPFIDLPYQVPMADIAMLAKNGEELDKTDKMALGRILQAINNGAKGMDITSTFHVNPTVSRNVSDIAAATNLSKIDKYNFLDISLKDPNYFYEDIWDNINYSPHSYLWNASLGNKRSGWLSEPAIRTFVTRLNSIGYKLDNPLKELLLTPQQRKYGASSIDLTDPEKIKLLLEWTKTNIPALYSRLLNLEYPYFPITTARKKGGKLIKKTKI